jgi:hypothetical protein
MTAPVKAPDGQISQILWSRARSAFCYTAPGVRCGTGWLL